MLICDIEPLLRSRLKVSITAVASGEPWVGTTTKPFEEDEYLLLHAVRKLIATRPRTATIQENLVRILSLISFERSYGCLCIPAAAHQA